MRLISPKGMDKKRDRALRLCMRSSKLEIDRDELLAAISEGMANIEEGVRIIDQDLPVPRLGGADLIAEDVRGRFVLICMADLLEPDGLGKALIRADWARNNLDLLGHMYSRDFPQEVRSWQMVGEVTLEAASLISRMDEMPAEVFTCEGVELGDDRWLVVRRYDAGETIREAMRTDLRSVSERVAPRPSSVIKNPRNDSGGEVTVINPKSVLTREEIDDFFDQSEYGEEITSSVMDSSKY